MATTKPKRVAARNAELEAAIDAAPDDPEPYWIYGDWLESQGDPRGEVIAAARASGKRERALLGKYSRELLGKLVRIKGPAATSPFKWRLGFIERARLRRRSAAPSLGDQVELLFDHPSSRFLRHLSLRTPDHRDDNPGYRGVLDVVARRAPPTLVSLALGEGEGATLASLALGEGAGVIGDLGGVLDALPSVRSLCLFTDTARFEPRSTEKIACLSIQKIRHPEPAILGACAWPALRHLELHYDFAAARSDVPPLPLGEDRFPCLRSVTIHFSRLWNDKVLWGLIDIDHVRRWESLRLDMYFLTSLDRWFFNNAEALGGLRELRLAAQEFGVSAASAEVFREALPNVTFGDIPIRDPFSDEERFW